MQEPLLEEIKQLLAKALRDTDEQPRVEADDHIINDLRLDSLQMVAFLLSVEERFGVALDFESLDISHFGTVREFAHFVSSLTGQRATG